MQTKVLAGAGQDWSAVDEWVVDDSCISSRASELFVAGRTENPACSRIVAQRWMMAVSSSTARIVCFVDRGEATSRLVMAKLLAYVEHTI